MLVLQVITFYSNNYNKNNENNIIQPFILVVNAAEYRRKIAGSDLLHDFFDEKNKDAEAIRLYDFY